MAAEQRRPPPARGEPTAVGDRGELLTQGQVEREILRLSSEMEKFTEDLVTQARRSAMAEAAYKREYHKYRAAARVVLDGMGPGGRVTNEEAQDYAIEKVTAYHDSDGSEHDLLLEHLLSESVFTASRDALKAKQSQIDALRTIAANIRSQT